MLTGKKRLLPFQASLGATLEELYENEYNIWVVLVFLQR